MTSPARPTVSVVMPSFQQAPFLGAAIDSVLSQENVEVELVVLDPGSTDSSREILAQHRRRWGDRLRAVCQSDAGQSEAVNRGMALARGRILGWLNSDDLLLPGALRRVVAALGPRDDAAWLYGQARIVDGRGLPAHRGTSWYKRLRGRRFSLPALIAENFIPQMAVFWNRRMWDLAGGLDTGRDLDMDYDLWLRFARAVSPIHLPVELAAHRVHAAARSAQCAPAQLRAAERTAAAHAAGLGWRGRTALRLHRLLRVRTRVVYALTRTARRREARCRRGDGPPGNAGVALSPDRVDP